MIFPIFTLACCVQHPSVSTAEFHPLPGQGAATPGDQLQSSHRVLAEHESCVSTRAAIWASMVPHEPHLPKSPNMRVYPWNTRPRQGSRDGAEPRGEAQGAQRLNEPGTGGTGTGEAVPNKAGKCCPRARLLGWLCLAPVPTASTASVRRVPDGTDNFQAHGLTGSNQESLWGTGLLSRPCSGSFLLPYSFTSCPRPCSCPGLQPSSAVSTQQDAWWDDRPILTHTAA